MPEEKDVNVAINQHPDHIEVLIAFGKTTVVLNFFSKRMIRQFCDYLISTGSYLPEEKEGS